MAGPVKSLFLRSQTLAGTVGLSVAVLCPALAIAGEPEPSDPIAVELRKSFAADGSAPEAINWDALNWDPWSLTTSKAPSLQSSGSSSDTTTVKWDQKLNPDGSTALTAKKQLPTTLNTNVGVDLGLGPDDPAGPARPHRSNSSNSGSAWANVSLSGATIDARLDPTQDQAKLGTTLKKSVPITDALSVSLENGYSVTETLATPGTMPSPVPASRTYSTDGIARVIIAPTGTTLSTGSRLSSTEDKWRRSLGAEQKVFGGLTVSGSVSETDTGLLDKAITAGFKTNW